MATKKLIVFLIIVLVFYGQVYAGDAYRDEEIGLAFPSELDGFNYRESHQYPQPGAGCSVRYVAEKSVKIDIYVYDALYENIEDGIASPIVTDQFDLLLSYFSYYEQKGTYINLKELERGTKKYGPNDMEFLWARYQFEQSPGKGVVYHGERISDAYLTAKKGKFIKVRLTLLKDEFPAREKDIDKFMHSLSALLSNLSKS